MTRHHTPARAAAAFAGALLLSACQTFSPDGGMNVTASLADQELRKDVVAIRTPDDAASAQARVDHLLKRSLTADAAVQVALLNNRGLQATYNQLGIAETIMVAGSLPPNLTLSVSRIASAADVEIERKIVGNILALATLPARAEIAQDRFRQAQLRATEQTCASPPMHAGPTTARSPASNSPPFWSTHNSPPRTRPSSPLALVRAARSTSSIRRASRYSTPRSPHSSQVYVRKRRTSASG